MQKRMFKSEKGSITLFVLLAILFFLIVIFSVFMTSSNKNRIQLSELDKIKQEYEKDVENIDEIYEEVAAKELIQVAFDKNGDTYNIAKDGIVDISTNVSISYEEGMTIISREYGWSNSSEKEPTSWTNFAEDTITVTNKAQGQGSYYLWVRVKNNRDVTNTTASNVFQVNENEIGLSKDINDYTKDKVTVTIDYKDTYVANKKVGIGKTVDEAMENVVANENTTVEITQNCFVYVTAEDAYGNVSLNYIEIDNIDTEAPMITLTPNGDEYVVRNNSTMQINVLVEVEDKVSGVKEVKYYWGTSNTEKPTDEQYTVTENNQPVSSEQLGEGIYYLWVKATDNAGNVREEPSYAYIVRPPLAPEVSLKENNANGKEYTSGTWTNQDVYHEISLPTTDGTVGKYQYSTNGTTWKDYIEEDTTEKIDYTTTFPMTSENKPEWLGDVTANGDYYFDVDENGALTSDGEHGNKGKSSSTANSYIKIDLTSFTNEDAIKVTLNANVSSESGYDYGYATITESETAPTYSSSTGRFIYISGTSSSVTTAKDYSATLTGGKVYYLHLGYRKDGSNNNGNDVFKINSIKLVNAKSETYTTTFPINNDGRPDWMGDLVNNGEYYFVENGNGGIKANNGDKQNLKSTTANSYIKLDLSAYAEDEILNVTVNAQVSSESPDYGYATITESETAPAYNSSSGRFIYISGTSSSSTTAKDYSTTLTGGKVYYLHFGYRKDVSVDSGDDNFTVNSITLSSDTMLKPIEFYDYTLNGNTATYTLKEDMNSEFYLKAIYEDGTESSISQFRIQIDKTAPVIGSISSELTSETKLDLTVSDIKERGSGLKGYYISTEETPPTVDSNWTSVTENTFEIENLDVGTKYYIWLIDNANNISEMTTIDEINANYRIDNAKYSETLEQALSLANNNSTIELLNNYTDSSIATVNKNIILNTGAYTLTRTQTITISGGTTDNPIIFELNGKITTSLAITTLTTSGYATIKGAGTIENTYESTSSSYRTIYNSGTLVQEGDLTISGYYIGLYNSNIYTLNSGKVENTKDTQGYGIYNYSSGDTVNINGGKVSGYNGVYNSSSSKINISEGEITGINYGIYISSGTANIDGGYISGIYGIYTGSSSGTVNVLSGMVVGSTYGIYGYTSRDGKITIGDLNTEVNQVSPVVSGGQYGIYMRNNNTYNFYNGIIMGTNAKPYTDAVNPREGYMVYTYYDYNNARKYCAVLTTAVDEITIEQTPTNDIWTNQDVTVQVKYPILEGSTLQYSENGQDWENVDNGYITTVSENKKVYARMLDASGIILQSKEHDVTNIDKIVPAVTINPETTKYTIYDKEQTDVDISVTVNVSDEGGSGLKTSKYGWSDSKETKPTEWNDLSNGQTITKENCTVGTYYLWFDVSDNAGNVSDVEVIRYMVELQEAVAQIVETGEYYYTIQEAIEAAGTTSSTIKIIKDTDEISTIGEGQNITIDLNGHTLGSSTSEQATITNNGTLTIIDNSESKTGTIENLIGTAIENNGALIIGDNTNAIDDNTPTISGNKTGIKNNNTLNYYDGTIIGKSAIDGNVQGTPESYGPVGVYENGMTIVNLRVVSDYVARIDWFYYGTLQSAFDACNASENNTEQTTVHMLKDIILDNTVSAYYGQNIQLNLNGYILTNANNTILDNYGILEITDLTDEQNGRITSSVEGTSSSYYKVIINNSCLNISGGTILSEQEYNYPLYNENGVLNIDKGTIISYSDSSTYGIYNSMDGTINMTGGYVNVSANTNNFAYGIYNANNGNICIGQLSEIDVSINSDVKSQGYGVYNANTGIVNIIGGNITVKSNKQNETGTTTSTYIYGIYNNSTGTINVINGDITGNGNAYSSIYTYGIYNKSTGNINITGGNVIANGNNSEESFYTYGIYNYSTGEINITGGNINSTGNGNSSYSEYNNPYVYGIYNRSTGRINMSGNTEVTVNTTTGFNKYAYGMYNASNGIVEFTGGTLNASSNTECYGIYNSSSGTINMGENAEIIARGNFYTYGIYNSSKGEINVVNGKINSSSPSDVYGIHNNGSGLINISGGNINVNGTRSGDVFGICNSSSGTVSLTGGNINCNSNNSSDFFNIIYGIYNATNNGIVNIGIKDNNINIAIPQVTITQNTDYYGYGIFNCSSGIINFYDGKIQTNKNTLVYGGITEIEENSEVVEEVVGDYKTIYLDIVNSEDYIIENTNTGKKYLSVQDAINDAEEENYELKVLKDFNLVTSFTIPQNVHIKIDLNGKLIKNKYFYIMNYGYFEITDKVGNGKIENNETIFYNVGNINMTGGNISSNSNRESYGIYNLNEGNININGGSITSEGKNFSYGIYNYNNGIINIINGNILGLQRAYVIYNNANGEVNISGGNIRNDENSTDTGYIIYNASSGIINMTGGNINANVTGEHNIYGIYNYKNGTINLEGGSITCKGIGNGVYSTVYGIYNSTGTVNMQNASISATSENNRRASCDAYGIYNYKGTINVLSGNINSYSNTDYYSNNSYGIYNGSTGVIEIGIKNDQNIDIMEPNIIAISTGNSISGSYGGYGVYNKNGILKFYDGRLEGSTRAIPEDSEVTEVEEIEKPEYSEDYTIYAYGISKSDVAKIGNVTYKNLQDAINNAKENDVIELLRGIQYTNQNTSLIVSAEKNIVIDLQGYQIVSAIQDAVFTIEGRLKIINTIQDIEGKITSSYDKTIYVCESGELEVNGGTLTNTKTTSSVILENKGIVKLSGGDILQEGQSSYGILNLNDGEVTMIDGNINCSDTNTYSIYNKDKGIVNIEGGNIISNLYSPYSSESAYGIYNENNGTINIKGGNININSDCRNSYAYGIYNKSNGIINILEGNVNIIVESGYKSYAYGIYNDNIGVVNIKNINMVINSTSIFNNTYAYAYGIINNEGDINIEDGKIQVSSNNNNREANSYSYTYGIYSNSGTLNIKGGNLINDSISIKNNSYVYGIYNSNNTIINIGVKNDDVISSSMPNIIAKVNSEEKVSNIYGILNSNGILNIYDGMIKGEDSAIVGNISSIEEHSEIVVGEETDEDNNTYETVSLVKIDSPLASVNGTEYYSLKDAVDNISETGTIQILRTGTVGETINNLSDKNVTIDLNGNTLNMYMQFENNGTLNITDLSSSASGILTGYKDRVINNNGNLTLSGGNISGITYGIYNNNGGITNISGGTLSNNEYGIYNVSGGTVNATNGTITGNTYGTFNYGGDINVTGGNITGNEYGVYNSSGTTNVTNGIINANTYGIYNNSGTTNISNLTITGNTTEVVNGGTGTTNILSGNIISNTIAVTNTLSGRVNIGSQDLAVDKENPVIQGEQYGIANTGTGSIAFYDGIVKGKEGSIQGYYLYTETGYIAQTNVVDGYYCDTLALSGTVTTVAKIGDIEYTNLQSAINACTIDTPTTITLVNSISSTQMFTIEEGQNVIIDLNGSTIATGTLEKLIENAGTLTIIDTNDRQTGKISNTSGIAINNTGTLNLGQDDGTVSTTCPEVVGKSTGIVNTGTFNFYDGIIKGAEALSGNVTARPDGYVINSSTDEATGMKQLTLGR